MTNETNVYSVEDVEPFDKIPKWKRLIYVLITDKDLHNRGTKQLWMLVFVGMFIGAVVGHTFGIKYMGAAVGCLLVLWFGDKTSGEIFSLVDNLQQIPEQQRNDIERKVVKLVQGDSVKAFREYIKVPDQYSKLTQILKTSLVNITEPREYSSIYFIVPLVLAAYLCATTISVDHQY